MSTPGIFLVILALCAVPSLAWLNDGEGPRDWFYDVGRPHSQPRQSKCKKDLLLVVDTSYSISGWHFNHNIKPFLESLVTNEVLNVGRDGTHVAMIIFSEKEKTRMLFNFGVHYDAKELGSFMSKLDWETVRGGRTRTDLALKIANEQVFTKNNPLNNRPDVDDVVIILTDGAPRGTTNTKRDALRNAGLLKDKGILVVGAAVGPKRHRFKHVILEMATSSKYVIDADFKNMGAILDKLVASSCIKPGQCVCHPMESSTIYVKPGHSTATVEWPEPQFSCMSGRKPRLARVDVEPPVQSPHAFSVGKHTVTYTFKLKSGINVVCPVYFKIEGEMCRGVSFNSESQVCCCGSIHTRKAGHDCCGPDYFNTRNQKCCQNANLISREKSCPREYE